MLVNKKILFSVGLFVFSYLLTILPIRAQLTLDSCQVKARQNYPLIKQFDLIEHSKEMTIANASKAYLPQFSITAIGGVVNGMPDISMTGSSKTKTEAKFIGIAQLNQVIWDGGSTKAQKNIVRAESEIEKQQVEVSLFAICNQVNQLFFGILLIDEQLKQLDFLQETLTKNLQRVTKTFENGAGFQSDIDDIKVELLNLEQNRIQQISAKEAYLEMLSYMTNEKIGTSTLLKKPSVEIIQVTDTILRPELSLYEQQRNMFNAQNSALTAGLMPKLGVMGYGILLEPSMDLGLQKIDHLLIAGLSLSWNIGNVYTVSNSRKKIKTNLAKIDVQEETFLFNTQLQMKQQKNEIYKSKQLLENDDKIIRLRESSKISAETKYENGVCTMTELIQKINDENTARQNKVLHEIQYLLNICNYNTIINKIK